MVARGGSERTAVLAGGSRVALLALTVYLGLAAGACSSSATGSAPPADAAIQDSAAPPSDSPTSSDAPDGDAVASQDASTKDVAGFIEAPHDPLPVLPNNGGPVLGAPKLVTIAYAGDPHSATMSAFGDWIVGSSWLTTVGHDYGVGLGAHAMHVVLPGPAPAQASDLDTQALLEAKLGDGTLPSAEGPDGGSGAADAGEGGYLYMIIYPSSTQTGSFLGGPSTCTYEGGGAFIGGYHWETQSGAYHVPYAVVPTCSSGAIVEGASDLEASASHEFIEAATDPFPYTDTAYGLTDPTDPWLYTAGEVADLCEGLTTTEAGFTAQRIWSNSVATKDNDADASAGGTSPCVPATGEPFYDVSPSPSQTQTVAAGGSVTFTLTGFSTAPVSPWSLTTFPALSTFTPTMTLGASTIDNGQTTTLIVGVPIGTPSGSYAAVFVTSSRSLTDFTYWPVAVTVP
jgi:hypothetical protein